MTDVADPATAASEAASSADAPASDGGEQFTKTWRDLIKDPDARKHADRYADVDALAKSALEGRRLASTAVRVPGDDASEEDWADFRRKLGVPESVDDYGYAPPELADHVTVPKEQIRAKLEAYHNAGLTKDQAKKLLDAELVGNMEADTAYKEGLIRSRQQKESALRQEWGGEYDRNVELGKRAGITYGGDGFNNLMANTVIDGVQLGNHPEMVRFMAKVGSATQEANLPFVPSADAAANLERRRADLTQQIAVAHSQGNRIEVQRLSEERAQLTQQLYPVGVQ